MISTLTLLKVAALNIVPGVIRSRLAARAEARSVKRKIHRENQVDLFNRKLMDDIRKSHTHTHQNNPTTRIDLTKGVKFK